MTTFFNTIILLGVLQGCIMGFLLFFFNNRRYSGRLLGGLIFLLTMASLHTWLNVQPWYQHSGWLETLDVLIPMVLVMPAGPLLYFYQLSILDVEFKLGKKQGLHFFTGSHEPTNLPLLAPALAIMNKYKDNPRSCNFKSYKSHFSFGNLFEATKNPCFRKKQGFESNLYF